MYRRVYNFMVKGRIDRPPWQKQNRLDEIFVVVFFGVLDRSID